METNRKRKKHFDNKTIFMSFANDQSNLTERSVVCKKEQTEQIDAQPEITVITVIRRSTMKKILFTMGEKNILRVFLLWRIQMPTK